MRRLKSLLLSMPNDTETYTPMYNGKNQPWGEIYFPTMLLTVVQA